MDPTTRFAGLTTAWLLFVVLLEGWLAPVAADPGLTTRVSVDSAGTQANSESADAALSADGRFVAFVSFAPNLVGGDTNDTCDIFVHDRRTGTTTCVGPGISPALSANGRFVAFESEASNLVAGDTNGVSDIFVHDRMRRR